jgi:hypothetical protein
MIELPAFVFENLAADEVEEVRRLLLPDGSEEFPKSLHPTSRRIEIARMKRRIMRRIRCANSKMNCVLAAAEIDRLQDPLPRPRLVPDS